jgi:hypothetical protein
MAKAGTGDALCDTCIEEFGVDVKDMADRAASTLKLTEGRYA